MLTFQKFISAAKKTDCSCVPFSQMATLYKGGVTSKGICHGLSTEWLGKKAAGEKSESILATFGPTGFDVPSAIRLSSATATAMENNDKLQLEGGLFERVTGLGAATKGGEQKCHTYSVSQDEFDHLDGGAAACVKWLGAARGDRYFMLSISGNPGHAMAVSSKGGKFEFFDPNGGVAIASNAKKLKSFFTTWFGTDDTGVYSHFKGNDTRYPKHVVAEVSKYKVPGRS